MTFVLRVVINAVAIGLATALLTGLEVVGGTTTLGRVGVLLAVALVFSVVNAVIKPVVKLLTLPLYVLTLGLFTVVVNALMLMLTAWVTQWADVGLHVGGFGSAVVGALLVSVVSLLLGAVTRVNRRG